MHIMVCRNPGCYMKDTKVKVEGKPKCLGCDRPMTDLADELIGNLFPQDNNPFGQR